MLIGRNGSSTEVFALNSNQTTDPAQNILEAMRKIQDTPTLKAQAATNLELVLNMLGLSGITRQAVAVGVLNGAGGPHPGTEGFWA